MNALYTWLMWLTAFSSASLCILVWVVPTLFKRLLSRPTRWPTSHRQALCSASFLALAAFWVYDALTQFPDIERSLWDVVQMGSASCAFAAPAIIGWLYLIARVVSWASKRAFVAPASGDLPVLFDQPKEAVPEIIAAPQQINYLPPKTSRRRATGRWPLQVIERLYRGVEAAERLAHTPSLLGGVLGIAIVVVITVVTLVGYVHSLGPWFSASSPTSNDLVSVAMISPTDGWAVGNDGAILHYHDGSWSAAVSPTSANLYSVAMVSPTDGWAVGYATILHYRDGSWSKVSSPASDGFYPLSIAMDSPTDGWVMGYGATALHYHEGSWTTVSIPTDHPLGSVAMVSSTEGWAVGDGGTILHYYDGSWSQISSPTNLILFSIAMASPSDGWAVGAKGIILRYHNGSWSSARSPTNYILHDVAMITPTDGWAVGEAGTVLHYSGGVWSTVSSPIELLFGVAMTSPTNGWAVGGDGTILHYSD